MRDIKRNLMDLQININSKGFIYWIAAIELFETTPTTKISDIYKNVAEMYNTTARSVERLMHLALSPAIPYIQKKYKCTEVTNRTFLYIF